MENADNLKTILCYGDSNTWGTVPGTRHERLARHIRWTGVLQDTLGEGYYVIEEGLSGRTTAVDDPFEEGRNGKTSLMPCLRTHDPIDLVIVLLGENDLKYRFAFTAADAARGAAMLVTMIQKSSYGRNHQSPKILLVTPAPLGKLGDYAEEFEGGVKKSQQLAEKYRQKAKELGCEYLDAGAVIQVSKKDGIHWDPAEHAKLAKAIAEIIMNMKF
jgi:lysophospholipase L1-like esterase